MTTYRNWIQQLAVDLGSSGDQARAHDCAVLLDPESHTDIDPDGERDQAHERLMLADWPDESEAGTVLTLLWELDDSLDDAIPAMDLHRGEYRTADGQIHRRALYATGTGQGAGSDVLLCDSSTGDDKADLLSARREADEADLQVLLRWA